jgi:outer membrane protein assembly factor BamB
MRVRCMLVLGLVCLASSLAFGSGASWSYKHNQDIKWLRLSGGGDVIAASDNAVFCVDPESGKSKWQREDLQGITSSQAEEVEGTPFLIVSKNNMASTKVTVVDITTGKTEWETDKLKGATVGIYPIYEKDMVLIFASKASTATKDKPDMYAFQLSTGKELWSGDFAASVDLHFAENKKRFIQKYDLSGHMPPIAEGERGLLHFCRTAQIRSQHWQAALGPSLRRDRRQTEAGQCASRD